MDEASEPRGMDLLDLIILTAGAAGALALARAWPTVEMFILEDTVITPRPYRRIELGFRSSILAGFAVAVAAARRLVRYRRLPRLGEWLASLLAIHLLLSTRVLPSPSDLADRLDAAVMSLAWNHVNPWLGVVGGACLVVVSVAAWLATRGDPRHSGRLKGIWATLAAFVAVWGLLPILDQMVRYGPWRIWPEPVYSFPFFHQRHYMEYVKTKEWVDLRLEAIATTATVVFYLVPAAWAVVRLLRRPTSPRPWTDRLGVLSFLCAGLSCVVLAQATDGSWYAPLEALWRSGLRWGAGAILGLSLAAWLPGHLRRRSHPVAGRSVPVDGIAKISTPRTPSVRLESPARSGL
ncbi:MAG: hypothetical protein JWN86_745 [Planctomycetota bacterium]|nr:hypothetical protein [Planctomycetota bacterium]